MWNEIVGKQAPRAGGGMRRWKTSLGLFFGRKERIWISAGSNRHGHSGSEHSKDFLYRLLIFVLLILKGSWLGSLVLYMEFGFCWVSIGFPIPGEV